MCYSSLYQQNPAQFGGRTCIQQIYTNTLIFKKIYLYLPKHIFLYFQRKGYIYEQNVYY